MDANDEVAAQIAALEKCCGWLFVPKGRRGPDGPQRVSARLMPKSFATPDEASARRLKAIFEDWPAWLARSKWQPDVVFAYSEGARSTVVRRVEPVAIGTRYAAGLAPQQLLQRSDVWRSAFPGAGELLRPLSPLEPTHYDARPHADVARGSNYLFGGLHTLAVAGSVDDPTRPMTEVGAKPINFAKTPSVALGGSMKTMSDALQSVANFAYRLGDRVNFKPDTPLRMRGSTNDPVLKWAASTQASSGLIKWDEPTPNNGSEAFFLKKLLACTAPDTPDTKRFLEGHRNTRGKAAGAGKEGLKLAQDMQAIAHHGWLLRYLGLVVDFELERPASGAHPRAFTATVGCPGAVVIEPCHGWPMQKPTSVSADPRGLPQRDGLIALDAKDPLLEEDDDDAARFEIVQVEVYSAAHKLVQMVASQSSLTDSAADPAERSFETSAQNSVGLSVVDTWADKANNNVAEKRPAAHGPGDYKTLYAEDITIGVRPDVQSLQPREDKLPVQSPWKSLTGWSIREAHLKLGPLPDSLKALRDITDLFAGVDAGEAVVGSAQRMLAASEKELTAVTGEELFTWSGWSLAVGHPDPGAKGGPPAFSELRVNNLVVTLQADGDLPALRVGRGYRFAARAVYADAGGLTLEEGRALYGCNGTRPFIGRGVNQDEFVPCLRYEPLAPPDIHLGERLDYADFPQAATRKVVVSSSKRGDHVRKKEVRYIVPPAVSLERAVMLGMYDSAARRSAPPASAFKGICLTPEGRLPNASNAVVPPTDAPRRSAAGDGSDTLFHASYFARDPVIPYLPDPWARRVVIGVYRASDEELLAWDYHDYYQDLDLAAWPNCRPLRFEICRAQDHYQTLPQAYGSAAGHVDLVRQGSTMQLAVPPGERLRVRFWHEIDEWMLAQSGIVDQMAEYLAKQDAQQCAAILGATGCLDNKRIAREQLIECLSQWSQLRNASIRAQISRERARNLTNVTSFGMLNPSEILDVVHAVDQPVAPSFLWSGLPSEEFEANFYDRYVVDVPARRLRTFEQTFRFRREPARSDATLAGDVEFDRATTQRLDVEVHWEDIEDDLAKPKFVRSRKNAILSVDNLPPILSRPPGRDDRTPNTRVTPDVPDDDNLLLLDGVRTRLGRDKNEDLNQKKLSVNFGDSRARIADLSITGISRHAREYPQAVGSFSSAPGKLEQVVCPASAPPRPVDLDYIIPQYRWRDNADGHKSHLREGGCFRVWLRRPWFSSGCDERLAVVCWPPETFDKDFKKENVYKAIRELNKPFKDPPQALEKFVTRWGLDPLWDEPKGAHLRSIPPEAFRRHVCDVSPLPLRTKQDACFPKLDLTQCVAVRDQLTSYLADSAEVVLVLYEPLYDDASRRWYVDIQIDEKYAYYPFVRLALARYQRYALPGMELSDILVQEFVQLPPERRTQLTLNERTPTPAGVELTLSVTLTGASGRPFAEVDAWKTIVAARLEYLPLQTWQRLRDSGKAPGFHEIAWVPDGEAVYLEKLPAPGWQLGRRDQFPNVAFASHTVTLRDDRVYSVVIEESELGWEDTGRPDPDWTPSLRRVFKDRLLVSELP